MPLINILLGTTLLLIALLAWQMLAAYQREELKARREYIRLIYAASRPSPMRVTRSRVYHMADSLPKQQQFMDVGREESNAASRTDTVEFIRLPQRSERTDGDHKNMTAGEGCHICA